MEDEQKNNEDDLVPPLTPALHQESGGDLAATVESVVASRDLAGADSVLHTRGGSHRVFTSNTDAVEEQRPDVADDPAVQGGAPSRSKHEKTDEHDDCILDETPAAPEPISKDTDQDLTDDDTTDLEVVDGLSPGLVADLVFAPAAWEGSRQQRLDVANGEEDVSVDKLARVGSHQ